MRLEAAAAACHLLGVEVVAESAEYAWNSRARDGAPQAAGWQAVTLAEHGTSREASHSELEGCLNLALEQFQPQAVFVPGWSARAALAT
jgi:LmbE family N-acetylglucosaminyl deacetylase